MKRKTLIDYEYELTQKDVEKYVEDLALSLEGEENIETPEEFVGEVDESKVTKRNIVDAFIWDVLEGSDDFKRYTSKYVREVFKLDFDTSDLGYYDWLFHQYLRDAFLSYSKSILDGVINKDKGLEQYFVEKEDITFMDIFYIISNKNGKKNFGKYILEKN